MRNGKLHALTWDKVDLENETVLVSSSWNKNDGLKDLIKPGQDRIIGIAPPLFIILKELKLSGDSGAFVLPRIADWDIGRQAEILRMFLASIKIYLRKAGIGTLDDFQIHDPAAKTGDALEFKSAAL